MQSKRKNKKDAITKLEFKIRSLNKQKRYYKFYIKANTVPIVVDGKKTMGGNENIKLSYLGENRFDVKILNHLK